nr:GH25 family lysozyme [Lacticaseibacillus kribbianus]
MVACVVAAVVAAALGVRAWQRRGLARYPVAGVVLDQSAGHQDFAALGDAGVDFAYLKATQGASYFDDAFTVNYDRSVGAAVRIGVYHYFSFDSTPEAQATQFLKQTGRDWGSLPIGVYLTYYGGYADDPPAAPTLTQNVGRFVALIQKATGKPVVLMGSARVLKAVSQLACQHFVIGGGRPSHAQFWQSGTLDCDGTRLPAAAFLGSKKAFAALGR